MMNELKILNRLLPTLTQTPDVVTGPGDDCAVLKASGEFLLLAAVDQVIGGVHYYSGITSPAAAGAKLMKRNLSDIAAMGGTPKWALLALAVNGRSEEWLLEFCRGAHEAGAAFGVPVVGGDLAELENKGEAGSLTILGEIAASEVILRSGARPGDRLYVTGEFGNSLTSGHHLNFTPRLREGRLLARKHFATAMLDVSDGLLLDAVRLACASQVDLVMNPGKVPLRAGAVRETAFSDGEDYELLFTVPQDRCGELERDWPSDFAPLHCIGTAEQGNGEVRTPAGTILSRNRKIGYEH